MALESTAGLVAQMRDEIGFDVPGGDDTLLGWLNGRHRRMVSESRCYRKLLSLSTVNGQSEYDLPTDVIEVFAVEVGGVPYDREKRRNLAKFRAALAVFSGPGGVVVQTASSSGQEQFSIEPVPSSVVTVRLLAAVRAPELSMTGGGQNPVVPGEFYEALVHGGAAPGLRRTEGRHSEADRYDVEFEKAIVRLADQTRRRWSNGPARIGLDLPRNWQRC